MGQPQAPYGNRGPIEYTTISTAVTFDPPIVWFQVITAGSGGLVVKSEDGTARTYAGLVAGDTYVGPFRELTSMTLSKIRVGDGPPPPNTAGLALGAIMADAQSTLARVHLPASTFYLATGAPLAAFSNGASAVPGSSFTDSKAFCVRWNDHTSSNAITRGFDIPEDADITANMTLHIRASQTGTAGASTFLVAAYNQVDGALDDADSDFGGTSSAMVAGTAKLVQNVTLTLALANLAAAPASVTITIKPTDTSMSTDDVCFLGAYVQYTRKLRSA